MNEESYANLYRKVESAIQFTEPKRSETLLHIFDNAQDENLKIEIAMIMNLINLAGKPIEGFSNIEVQHYQDRYFKEFFSVLTSAYPSIEYKIHELEYRCKKKKLDFKITLYEFEEQKETDQKELCDTEKYILYLKNLNTLTTSKPKIKLSLSQIAILYLSNEEKINKTNMNSIATIFKWKSGDKLYQFYARYKNNVADLENEKKLKKLIKDYETVTELVYSNKRAAHKKAIESLKANL